MHIDRNNVFWMLPVHHDAVEVDFDSGRARLRLRDQDVFDDNDIANSLTLGLGIPAAPFNQPSVFPVRAKVSVDVEWNGAITTAQIDNTDQHFKGAFLSTNATIVWSSEQEGFQFASDNPADPAANLVSVLGREKNGAFFSP